MSELTVEMVKGDGGVPLMGGNPVALSWDEYRDLFYEKYRPHVDALRAEIEARGLVGTTADKVCNDHFWRFSDGEEWAFTWRAWGDLMQAIVNKREGYMAYYMD